MSLTDITELKESGARPIRKTHFLKFDGSTGSLRACDYNTGHCSNTDACHSCEVYNSIHEVREHTDSLKGDAAVYSRR
jgi:hypothetical protein